MYEIADSRDENLNNILQELQQEGIEHEKTLDKIIFRTSMPNLDPSAFAKAQEMMGKMDPSELQKIQEKVANMSEEEKAKLLEQAKTMGLF